jgi:hypothetical protein
VRAERDRALEERREAAREGLAWRACHAAPTPQDVETLLLLRLRMIGVSLFALTNDHARRTHSTP